MKNFKKILYNISSYLIIIIVTFISAGYITKSAISYNVQFGGRIIFTIDPTTCADPLTCASCNLCGCGPWWNVLIQPYGGTGFFLCPTFTSMKGNDPMFTPGSYVISGGSDPHVLDPNNTASVKGEIKGNLMVAWFMFVDKLPNI
jgi:hypothetical protein